MLVMLVFGRQISCIIAGRPIVLAVIWSKIAIFASLVKFVVGERFFTHCF